MMLTPDDLGEPRMTMRQFTEEEKRAEMQRAMIMDAWATIKAAYDELEEIGEGIIPEIDEPLNDAINSLYKCLKIRKEGK
jgi:hypothetical protein